MRALIVTIRDSGFNYGNKLQNYAVKKILEKHKYKAETLCFEVDFKDEVKTRIKYQVHRLTNFRFVKNKKYWLEYGKFREFDRKYIPARYIDSPEKVKGYDLYVIGSDQVWNAKWYQYRPVRKDFYLLNFGDDINRLCMAPSFGINSLPNEWKSIFSDRLKMFQSISVRENEGANIIKELTGKDAFVMIDPTMQLTREEWLDIAKKPKDINTDKPYILTYFLGESNATAQNDICIIAKTHKLDIYNLMDKDSPELWRTGPCEFIYLISEASLIVTDSFHASVFSFLFQKPFLVYDRIGRENDMNSRIYTFLEMFNLEKRYVKSKLPVDVMNCNYEFSYKRLNEERIKAKRFIEESMSR